MEVSEHKLRRAALIVRAGSRPAALLRTGRGQTSGGNYRAAIRLWSLVAAACVSGCALFGPRQSAPLAVSVRELVPHNDRDHFVFIWQRTGNGQTIANGIQVEHITAIAGGDFEITLSENATQVGRVRIRDVGQAIVLLSEDDLSRGVRLQYDPPLPYLVGPVVAGEQQASSQATITALSDGSPVGTVQVAQVIQVEAAGSVRSRLGSFDHAVAVRTTRTLHGSSGDLEMGTAMVLVPGIGEIRSDGSVLGAPALHRELACAFIDSHPIGDCHHLNDEMKELDRAVPADGQ